MMNDKRDYSPIGVLGRLWESIECRYKITFYSAIVCGLLAHLFQFTNKLYNFDELDATPTGYVAGVYLGRWSQALIADVVKKLFSNTSLPMVNGMLALLFFSLAACLTVRILKVENKLCCGIIGGLCVTFPAVTCTYFYMYMSWYYALSLLLATIAALIVVWNIDLTLKGNTKRVIICDIVSIMILAFATGIYQAYFPVAATLFISALIMGFVDAINTDKSDRDTFFHLLAKAVEYVLVLIAALVLYLLVNKAAVKITGTVLPTYQGMNEIGSLDIKYSLGMAFNSYKYLIKLVFADVYQLNYNVVMKIMTAFIFLSGALSVVLILYPLRSTADDNAIGKREDTENGGKYGIIMKLGLCFLLLIYPISLFLIHSMSTPQTDIYAIMMYAVVFALIMPIALIERAGTHRIAIINSWIGSLAGAIIIFVYIWFANGCYQTLQYTNMHDIAFYTTVVTQIKSVEGYSDDIPVILVGCGNIEDKTVEDKGLIGDEFHIGGRSESNVNAYSAINIIREYIGFRPNFLWDDDSQKQFYTDQRVIDMPCYPDDGCMKVMDDTVVVKLGEIDNNEWMHEY